METLKIFLPTRKTVFGRSPSTAAMFTALAAGLWLLPDPALAQIAQDKRSDAMPPSVLSRIESSAYSSLSSDELDETRGTMMFSGSIDLAAEGIGSKHFQFHRNLKPGEHFSISREITGPDSQASGELKVFLSPDGSTTSLSSSSQSSSGLP